MSKTSLQIFDGNHSLSQSAAGFFEQLTRAAVRFRGKFFCALSGGGTPLALFQILAQPPYAGSLPWDKMYFFWADERCVLPNDPGSNYFQARQAWLARVPVPENNIIRVKGELAPQLAADDYARQLKSWAEASLAWPRFDLILLGLGADGHTASLFPGSPIPTGLATVAVTANYQDRPANRVSMTPDLINTARNVAFLVTGSEKASALAATITGSLEPDRLPAQRIRPTDGSLWWFVDQAAASRLPAKMDGVVVTKL